MIHIFFPFLKGELHLWFKISFNFQKFEKSVTHSDVIVMSSGLSRFGLEIFNKLIVCGQEFDRRKHLPGKGGGLTNDTTDLHYGKCRIQKSDPKSRDLKSGYSFF